MATPVTSTLPMCHTSRTPHWPLGSAGVPAQSYPCVFRRWIWRSSISRWVMCVSDRMANNLFGAVMAAVI